MKKNILHFKEKVLNKKKAVFGLSSVQAFFAIILGISLLAYVIVIIAGTLTSNDILSDYGATVVNETGYINATGYTLAPSSTRSISSVTIILVNNQTVTLNSGNYTFSNNDWRIYNSTTKAYSYANITYSYTYRSTAEVQSVGILSNTSTGVKNHWRV